MGLSMHRVNNNVKRFFKSNLAVLSFFVFIFVILKYVYTDYVLHRNAKELFSDGKMNEFMFFKANWCKFCISFSPTFDKLVKIVNEDDNLKSQLILRKFDNDIGQDKPVFAQYNVKTFPTLIFKSKDGNVIKYDGERDVDSLVMFLKKNVN